MKNVLFIVYYFPPMGGSGVQRPLKFVKYLRSYGWNPIVLTPKPGAYHTFDETLEKELQESETEVFRVDAKTPFHTAGQKPRKIDFIPGWIAKPLRKISTFFWLPDNKTGWIEPGVTMGEQLIKKKDIKAIFSTAPPYSNHLIAERLKKITGVPVIMDMRDDWLESHLIKYPTPYHKKKMAKIESMALGSADIITVINKDTQYGISKRLQQSSKVKLLNQGFDPEDFSGTESVKTEKLIFLYSGLFYGERTPETFLKAAASFLSKNHDAKSKIEFWFQGGLDDSYKELVKKLQIENIVIDLGYVPHRQAVQNLIKADVLWLIVGHSHKANQVTVGKMFEYFGTKTPILGLVPEGSSKDLLDAYGAGFVSEPRDVKETEEQIAQIFKLWEYGRIPEPNEDFIQNYNRKNITGELAKLLDEISL